LTLWIPLNAPHHPMNFTSLYCGNHCKGSKPGVAEWRYDFARF
jgi:hypothetical protein